MIVATTLTLSPHVPRSLRTRYVSPFLHSLLNETDLSCSEKVAHTTVLKAGTPAVIMRRFDLEEFLGVTDRFKITEWVIVPPIAIGIVMSPVTKKYSLKSVRNVMVGAAPLSKESQLALKKLLQDGCFVLQ